MEPPCKVTMKWFKAAKESGIPALVKFTTQKECRISGLAAHAIFPISPNRLEGFNNKIKAAKYIGYGYERQIKRYRKGDSAK